MLQQDDLEVGMVVTVIHGPKYHRRVALAEGSLESVATDELMEDKTYQGEILTIRAIDRPFVVLDRQNRASWGPVMLDMRRGWQLRQPSKEYVAALTQEPSP